MLVDFPDYSHANPWQVKMIDTCAPMEVKRVNELKEKDCYAFHISWEDYIFKSSRRKYGLKKVLKDTEKFLNNQSKHSKIIWTLHNLTSHSFQNKTMESEIREMLMDYSSLIILMSKKHEFMIPNKHKKKIQVVPHFIDNENFYNKNLTKFKYPTFFKYGAFRGNSNPELYLNILKNQKIRKFVSDPKLDFNQDDINSFITKRRFSSTEELIFSNFSNFSIFYRKPNLNSSVLNHYIGNKLVVLHNSESVQYFDLPSIYSEFNRDITSIEPEEVLNFIQILKNNQSSVNKFINERKPEVISKIFWTRVLNLQ